VSAPSTSAPLPDIQLAPVRTRAASRAASARIQTLQNLGVVDNEEESDDAFEEDEEEDEMEEEEDDDELREEELPSSPDYSPTSPHHSQEDYEMDDMTADTPVQDGYENPMAAFVHSPPRVSLILVDDEPAPPPGPSATLPSTAVPASQATEQDYTPWKDVEMSDLVPEPEDIKQPSEQQPRRGYGEVAATYALEEERFPRRLGQFFAVTSQHQEDRSVRACAVSSRHSHSHSETPDRKRKDDVCVAASRGSRLEGNGQRVLKPATDSLYAARTQATETPT
jgi:hypothetical protein